jgi:hypothetical protein
MEVKIIATDDREAEAEEMLSPVRAMPCQQQSNCKDAICNANDGIYASRSIRNVTIDLMPKAEHSR